MAVLPPRLPFQAPYAPLGEYPQAYETWFKRAVGAFGWLEVRWPPAIYAGLLAVWLSMIGSARRGAVPPPPDSSTGR